MSKFAFASTALSLGAAAAHHIFETYSADGGCTNVETAAANFKEVLALAAFGLAASRPLRWQSHTTFVLNWRLRRQGSTTRRAKDECVSWQRGLNPKKFDVLAVLAVFADHAHVMLLGSNDEGKTTCPCVYSADDRVHVILHTQNHSTDTEY